MAEQQEQEQQPYNVCMHASTSHIHRYLVWSGASTHGGGYVYNARFIVQSNDRSPGYLDQRVESFIAGFREVSQIDGRLQFCCSVGPGRGKTGASGLRPSCHGPGLFSSSLQMAKKGVFLLQERGPFPPPPPSRKLPLTVPSSVLCFEMPPPPPPPPPPLPLFLRHTRGAQTLSSQTEEAFGVNVRAVVESLLEKDKNLTEETRRHWGEIAGRSYMFDRSLKDAAAVGGLSQVRGATPRVSME